MVQSTPRNQQYHLTSELVLHVLQHGRVLQELLNAWGPLVWLELGVGHPLPLPLVHGASELVEVLPRQVVLVVLVRRPAPLLVGEPVTEGPLPGNGGTGTGLLLLCGGWGLWLAGRMKYQKVCCWSEYSVVLSHWLGAFLLTNHLFPQISRSALQYYEIQSICDQQQVWIILPLSGRLNWTLILITFWGRTFIRS